MNLHSDKCSPGKFELTDWTHISKLKQKSKQLSEQLKPEIEASGIEWESLKEICNYDLTLWKLLLKRLREIGYDIGSIKRQSVIVFHKDH